MQLSGGSKAFLVLLALAVAGALVFLRYADTALDADPDLASEPVTFDVPRGISRGELAELLEDEGIVGNAQLFDAYARTSGFFRSLEAGTYQLRTNMAAEDVVAVFEAGPEGVQEVTYTVEEGLSQELTLERLAAQFPELAQEDFQSVLDAQLDAGGDGGPLRLAPGLPDLAGFGPDVRYPFEGVLFPQTYRVAQDADATTVLQRMADELTQQLDVISPAERELLEERGLSVYDAMVIASLIERETRVEDERAVVASVIYNRLDEGMMLQIDATVLYALGQWRERVLFEDTEVDSPYNTYQVQGLPPTPISGFGEASLRAALAPAETDFRYYVLTPACDGRHVFAQTLEEHNANVAAFREVGGCRDDG